MKCRSHTKWGRDYRLKNGRGGSKRQGGQRESEVLAGGKNQRKLYAWYPGSRRIKLKRGSTGWTGSAKENERVATGKREKKGGASGKKGVLSRGGVWLEG